MSKVAKHRLKVLKINIGDLQVSQVEEMWALYSKNYGNVERALFDKDLREKDCVFYGTNRDNKSFAGFTTAKFYTTFINGKKAGIFYSGDTMFLREYWGQYALHQAVAKEVLLYKLRTPGIPLYWFLVVMGYRTYLTMARNFKNYWPSYAKETPPHIQKMLDLIAKERFGAAYSPETGLIMPQGGLVYLKDTVAPITKEIAKECPEVRFLLKRNPGYAQGVEMPCLGRFDWGFVKIFTAKVLRSLLIKKKAIPLKAKTRSDAEVSGSYAN